MAYGSSRFFRFLYPTYRYLADLRGLGVFITNLARFIRWLRRSWRWLLCRSRRWVSRQSRSLLSAFLINKILPRLYSVITRISRHLPRPFSSNLFASRLFTVGHLGTIIKLLQWRKIVRVSGLDLLFVWHDEILSLYRMTRGESFQMALIRKLLHIELEPDRKCTAVPLFLYESDMSSLSLPYGRRREQVIFFCRIDQVAYVRQRELRYEVVDDFRENQLFVELFQSNGITHIDDPRKYVEDRASKSK